MKKELTLSEINATGDLQTRVQLRDDVVEEYAEAMKAGAEFPPIVVFQDKENLLHLADGHYRLMAAETIGAKTITADVRKGTRQDALIYALGANSEHGQRRTNADKQKAVKMALADAAIAEKSDRAIAEICNVSPEMVGTYRPKQTEPETGELSENDSEKKPTKRIGKDGVARKMAGKRKEKPAKKAKEETAESFGDDDEKPGVLTASEVNDHTFTRMLVEVVEILRTLKDRHQDRWSEVVDAVGKVMA